MKYKRVIFNLPSTFYDIFVFCFYNEKNKLYDSSRIKIKFEKTDERLEIICSCHVAPYTSCRENKLEFVIIIGMIYLMNYSCSWFIGILWTCRGGVGPQRGLGSAVISFSLASYLRIRYT